MGNQALSHYEEVFVSGGACLVDGSTCHRFGATSYTTDALGLGPTIANFVYVPNGGTVAAVLTWDDDFGSTTSDYDLYLYDNVTSELVAVGGDDNIGVTGVPVEYLAWTNTTGGDRWYDIEPYSSRGPANNGATKPDVAAIDGVSVTGSGGFPSTFYGTSAAPHVAGLAALLLDLRPDLLNGEPGDDPTADRAALRAGILDAAVDLGVSGVDNT